MSDLYREDAQGRDLAPIFEDLSQSENFSEIKPPLVQIEMNHIRKSKTLSFAPNINLWLQKLQFIIIHNSM